MILVPVALAIGLLCLVKAETFAQQVWTMIATAGGVGVVLLGVHSGDPMVLIFGAMLYMVFLIIWMTVSDWIRKRHAARPVDPSAGASPAPAPANKAIYAVIAALIFGGMAVMALGGDHSAAAGLSGMGIGVVLGGLYGLSRRRSGK
jgi:hypothetical protein